MNSCVLTGWAGKTRWFNRLGMPCADVCHACFVDVGPGHMMLCANSRGESGHAPKALVRDGKEVKCIAIAVAPSNVCEQGPFVVECQSTVR